MNSFDWQSFLKQENQKLTDDIKGIGDRIRIYLSGIEFTR